MKRLTCDFPGCARDRDPGHCFCTQHLSDQIKRYLQAVRGAHEKTFREQCEHRFARDGYRQCKRAAVAHGDGYCTQHKKIADARVRAWDALRWEKPQPSYAARAPENLKALLDAGERCLSALAANDAPNCQAAKEMRLESFVSGTKGKRLTYKALIQ